MKISTKLDIGQICYVILNNKVVKGKVLYINIDITASLTKIDYKIRQDDGLVSNHYFREEVIFSSADKLFVFLENNIE